MVPPVLDYASASVEQKAHTICGAEGPYHVSRKRDKSCSTRPENMTSLSLKKCQENRLLHFFLLYFMDSHIDVIKGVQVGNI